MVYEQHITLYPGLKGCSASAQVVPVVWQVPTSTVLLKNPTTPYKAGDLWTYWHLEYFAEQLRKTVPVKVKTITMYERLPGQEIQVLPERLVEEPKPVESFPDFVIENHQLVFSGATFEGFHVSEIIAPEEMLDVVFKQCVFIGDVMIGYYDSSLESFAFEDCVFKGAAYFSGRWYKHLRFTHCKFFDTADLRANLDLSSVYYGLGTALELTHNHFQVFVDFFDSALKSLTVRHNYFGKGSNLFAEDPWLETDVRCVEHNTGALTLTERP